MRYKHLNYEQRYSIECMLTAGLKKKDISIGLGISESTLYRELKRNQMKRGGYRAKHAQMLAKERHCEGHHKKKFTSTMKRIIKERLEQEWSPEQIVGWCKNNGIDMVSHERIYQHIWEDKSRGGRLYRHLRTGQKKYRKRYGSKSQRGQIPARVTIDKRPPVVEQKDRIGDFEIDLIVGPKHKGAMLTIVDRKTNFTLTEPLADKSAKGVEKALINALAPFRSITHTITSDNGKEFYNHQSVSKKLQTDFFFAHPYASWQRGANENTNKLIRQYLPKNADLRALNNQYNLFIMNRLNNRPRKKLGYKTPAYVFFNEIRNEKLALVG